MVKKKGVNISLICVSLKTLVSMLVHSITSVLVKIIIFKHGYIV